jgi:hypothetical protein
MSEETYSFVFDRQAANEVFKQIGKRELVLAVIATLIPETHWNGCLVYEGETPLEEIKTVCIGIQGPAADEVQERLVEKFEKAGVPILQVYEGGPEVREPMARAEEGKWKTS